MEQIKHPETGIPLARRLPNGRITELRPQPKRGLLDAIMSPQPASQRPAALAAPSAGPRKVRSGGQSRSIRRQRKAGRVQRTEKVNKQTAQLQRKREQVLDTAAAFARIWFAGPPTEQKKVGVSAYDRVRQRVYKQAEGLVKSGKASSWEDAVEQIEDSMHETIRQHDVLLAQKAMAPFRAAKQAVMDAHRSDIDARTGHPVVG